ncbi:MAG: DUF4037 domain-containing protein [Deltaproteobacteria bacterium]|nr:DUF4037 domain-containing protein [Deltaproteobacteria bacterium]
MKGLELTEKFFTAYGMPLLEDLFQSCRDRIAAGLVGDGSDCFGFDDELSQDHDWGPGFCLWLTREDFETFGRDLAAAYGKLPGNFMGFSRKESAWGQDRVGVFEISAFYRTFTGYDHLPGNLDEWLSIPENALAACTNGDVFYDPLGEFTRWRKYLLAFYPEDVRLKKIASRCMTIAQSGQYNLARCLKRKDLFAAQYAETKFCADVISLVFLINRRYPPFYKWMQRALSDLPRLGGSLSVMIAELVTTNDHACKINLVEEISASLIAALREEGLSDADSDFLLDHGPRVQSRIQDDKLRQRNVWIG